MKKIKFSKDFKIGLIFIAIIWPSAIWLIITVHTTKDMPYGIKMAITWLAVLSMLITAITFISEVNKYPLKDKTGK